MKILARLPNWLGDVVMSLAFIEKLAHQYPGANIEVIVKKGLGTVLQHQPHISKIHVFDKEEYTGLKGAFAFGRYLRSLTAYDVFFCLPNSFSSALMGFASGAQNKVGFKKEFRSLLLTHAFKKPDNLHRAEEYCSLIDLYAKKNIDSGICMYQLQPDYVPMQGEYGIVNLNSEAISRKIPLLKSIELVNEILNSFSCHIKLTGGAKDVLFIGQVYAALPDKERVQNIAGQTSISDMINLMSGAQFIVSSDSGPAHIAAALHKPLVVIFGAGNEANTGPLTMDTSIVVRYGKLPCEPCVKNTCKLAPLPVCLTELDVKKVIRALYSLQTFIKT